MGKKVCYTLFLTICLLLAVSVSAFAAEVPVVLVEPVKVDLPADIRIKGEQSISLFNAQTPLAWDVDSECYGDQLKKEVQGGDGEMYTLYGLMEDAFAQGNVTYDEINGRWVTPILVEQQWSVQQYIETYGIAVPEGEEFEAWNIALNEAIGAWFQTYYDLLWDVADAFTADHPEYFWVRTDGGCMGYSVFSDETFIYEDANGDLFAYNAYCTAYVYYGFSFQAGCETEELVNDLQEQLDKQVEALMEATEDMSAVQKIIYWDNWLAEQNVYNYDALTSGLAASSYPWSIVSGLLSGCDPVCEGYAKTLQLLCNKAGIPCVQVSGYACNDLDKDPQEWEPHMWLAIKMEDGNWYLHDSTWNDPPYGYGDPDRTYSTREYLLVAQQESHWVPSVEAELGTPTLSITPYFENQNDAVEAALPAWSAEGNTFTGMEIGSGAMMIILYDENGKMLDLGFCEKGIQWGENEWLYLAPVFDAEDLAQATRIVRINVGDKTAWSPLTALKAIKEAPEVDPPEAE